MPRVRYVVKLTMDDAKALGIVFCVCGHPWNNHFQFKNKPCAFCDEGHGKGKCPGYKRVFSRGKAIK